jgi:hypothetical protein
MFLQVMTVKVRNRVESQQRMARPSYSPTANRESLGRELQMGIVDGGVCAARSIRLCAALSLVVAVATASGMAAADPIVREPLVKIASYPVGSGFTAYDLTIDGNDGEFRSFYIEMEFTGPIEQIQYLGLDIDSDEDAIAFDGIGGYDASLDSYFIQSVWELEGPPLGTDHLGFPGSTTYQFSGGTYDPFLGEPQQTYLTAAFAHIVIPTGSLFSYDGVISRGGANYPNGDTVAQNLVVFGVVPEPSTGVLVGLGLGVMAWRQRAKK